MDQWNEDSAYPSRKLQREGRPFLIVTRVGVAEDYGKPALVDLTSSTVTIFDDRTALAKELNDGGYTACDD